MPLELVKALLEITKFCINCGNCSECLMEQFCGKLLSEW